jgi:ATP-dependent helicase/nuclease subunit A
VSERGEPRITPETQANQSKAANPGLSIWVSANAGSGKTYVLTRRVLRLLLTGVAPQSILCLTYTKAAAAEMRRRVAGELARWAVAEEGALVAELRALEGSAFHPGLVERARTLFAKALETPGGLKIVTIHAFCESVLHRFPLEAGVPFDFTVIEDDERNQMMLAVREAVLAEGLRGEGPAEAIVTLFDLLSDHQITSAIDAALGEGRKLEAVLADPRRAKANLRKLVGAGNFRGSAAINEAVLNERLVGAREIERLHAICPPTGASRLEDKLAEFNERAPLAASWQRAFLTEKETVPARGFPAKKICESDPNLADMLLAEAERLQALAAERRKALLIERSEALLDVVATISARYEAQKRARSLLDFDDLVERLGDLFADRSVGPWVQYKLDTAIDHILVDESQDTNREQWRVVTAIAEEFFAGAGGASRPRSLFAVGDQKQSIYSFQGAEPELFAATGEHFRRRASETDIPFEPVPLHTSFRTLPEILKAVDLVSDLPGMGNALLSQGKVFHDTARPTGGGSVTLWPPIQQQRVVGDSTEWPKEPVEAERSASRQVAERIAGEIVGWVGKRPLTGRGRMVRAEDVLILVQSRGVLFGEIIRALRRAGLPTPGADRLGVTSHIGVMDLLALCDVLLNPADDLQLAALLRSPLFDVDEDDLFALAQPRAQGQTLWSALEECPAPNCREAFARLARWRSELDFERPFEFLAQVLYAEGGLKRFHARLGEEVDEVFAELLELALAHEQRAQPSLQGFVAEMRGRHVTIKRELTEANAGVRVMTVHGAKGLEAPIVILADAASKPSAGQTGKAVYVRDGDDPVMIHASSAKLHTDETLPIKQNVDEKLLQEYWRKLYVAMTRAEDELYVTGCLSQTGKLEGSWYEAVDKALRGDAEVVADADGNALALIYPRERIAPAPAKTEGALVPLAAEPLIFTPVPEPNVPPLATPSSAGGHVTPVAALDSLGEQVRDAGAARQEGIALHALLQHLGRVERALWPAVVPMALAALLPDLPDAHERLGAKAVSILSRPELAPLFGSASRAEIPFLVHASRNGEPIRLAGRMDRVVVDEHGVLVIDYKSDASVPGGPGDVPGNYRTQLGLYALVAGQLFPGHPVRAAILWTHLESLMNLPASMLAEDIRDFTMR